MTLKEQLDVAMKDAMRAKDALRLSTIRMAKSAIKYKEVELIAQLDDQGVIGVLSTLAKQRKESAVAFREGNRLELAEKEEQELAVLLEFLPQQLDEAGIKVLIEKAVAEAGASSAKDMGKVMKLVTPQTTGRADGKLVSELVKARLAGA
ncbi:MAG: glutamyl-tRNA amidotransferase [Desulfuromonadales bacterium GWC2_61_20]|nr:MAG: glutamyl-tRNA amidotransferase [Desulfuromonadales bacterium GWC2_61_20]HAD03182.1 glutamyl-tRNA amidotransferase [Desulfuromonas sp.]